MHPILANRRNLALYALCWLILSAILSAWFSATGLLDWRQSAVTILPAFTLYAFACLSPWYLCRVLPIRRTGIAALIGNHLGAAMVVAAMWLAAISTGVRWVAGGEEKVEALLPLLYFSGLLLYVLSTLLHYLLVSLEASRAAESLARDSQLKALRMQINPHFLFNSLNSISALATLDGARARDMCIRLSDLLRSTLQVGEKQTISLKDEIALSVNYLEVERVRFGARLMIEREFQDMCGECSVPPLIVQPLVENAVKHGIAGLVEGGVVRLEAKCGNGRLLIRVVNPFDPEMPAPRQSGFGLANVRQRLAARYGDDASFESSSENSEFRAELRFPCGGAAELA